MTIDDFIDRIRLPFRKEKELYCALHGITGLYPHDIDLYKEALMHKSVSQRNEKGKPVNNERLEFLGDAILGAIVGDIVYRHFDGKREGFLTNTRSKIVQRETLNRLANEIGLSELIVSSGHPSTHNSYMEGNAFEALVGAIYLDRGYEACARFMRDRILAHVINIDKVAYKEVNFKSKLIEWCQKNKVRLDFKVLEERRDDKNSPVFTCQAFIEGQAGEKGTGYSKKESQQAASKSTLQRLRRRPQFVDAIFAAKTDRTKMEEVPVEVAPDPDEKVDFINSRAGAGENGAAEKADRKRPPRKRKPKAEGRAQAQPREGGDSMEEEEAPDPKAKSREDIIAEAERAAFTGEG